MSIRFVGVVLVVVAALILTSAQLLIKSRLTLHGVVPFDKSIISYALRVLADWKMWLAGLGLIASSLCWYAAVSRLPLSVAYPLAALSYPAVLLGTVVLLGEPVSWYVLLGNAFVVLGIFLVTAGI